MGKPIIPIPMVFGERLTKRDGLAPLSYMPDDAVAVAAIHSHPNSHSISKRDKEFGDAYGLDVYVVMPGLEGKADIWKSVKTRDGRRTLAVATGTGVAPLSEERKKELVGKFQSKWYAHVQYGCPDDFGCENLEWPRTL